MKAILLIASLMMITATGHAHAGESTVLSKTESIEITNPAQAFACSTGDGGFIWTNVSLNTFSIPNEYGSNFRKAPGISASFSNRNGAAVSCADAMKTINDEIQKQGGKLKVSASRSLTRFAYLDQTCQLHMAENVRITVGSVELSGVATFFVKEIPFSSASECNDLIPDKI